MEWQRISNTAQMYLCTPEQHLCRKSRQLGYFMGYTAVLFQFSLQDETAKRHVIESDWNKVRRLGVKIRYPATSHRIRWFMITKGRLGYLSSMYFSTCGWVCLQSLILPCLVFVFLLGPPSPIRFLPGPWNIPSRSLIPAVLRSLLPILGSNDYFITSFVYFSCFLCVVVPAALLHTFPSSFSWPCWLHNFFAILYFLSYCLFNKPLQFRFWFNFSPLNYTPYI